MLELERSVITVVARRLRSRAAVELENLALRHQLDVLRPQRPGRRSRLSSAATKNRSHRGGVHDSEILVAVVEDHIRSLDALFLQILQTSRERLKLAFRVQVFEALARSNIPFEPVVAIPAMKAHVHLVAGRFDK